MVARFPAMIAVLRNCIKTGTNSCTVPVNLLCIRVLELLRTHGLIQGYAFIYTHRKPRKAFFSGSPRVMITLKFTDNQSPILKDIQSFKNTISNFKFSRHLKGNNPLINEHVMYIISNPNGLQFTLPSNLKESKNASKAGRTSGKLIAQLII